MSDDYRGLDEEQGGPLVDIENPPPAREAGPGDFTTEEIVGTIGREIGQAIVDPSSFDPGDGAQVKADTEWIMEKKAEYDAARNADES